MPKLVIILICLVFSFTSSTQNIWSKRIDSVIVEGMGLWQVPGLAIAIIQEGEVTYKNTFGYESAIDKEPIRNSTAFAIGSTSKAFTSTALAHLLASKDLSWDTRIIDVWPSFQLKNWFIASQLTIRDVLSHRTGLPGNDLVWYGNEVSRAELMGRLKYLDASNQFRNDFTYNNLMYLLAGHLIKEIAAQSWDEYLSSKFLGPLGMEDTFTDYDKASRMNDFARPHAVINDSLRMVPHLNLNMVAPAGGVYSTIDDLAKWLTFLLTENELKEDFGDHFIETQRSQINLPPDPFLDLVFKGSDFLGYGMGWFVHSYHGHKVVEHTGNTDGFSSHIALMPDQNFGVVILTNLNANFLSFAVKNRIFDFLLSRGGESWNQEIYGSFQQLLSSLEPSPRKPSDDQLLPDFGNFVGEYMHNFYGRVTISLKEDRLNIKFLNGLEGQLDYWQHNTFEISWENELHGQSLINFVRDFRGELIELKIDRIGLFPLNEVFKRRPGNP